MTSPFRKAVKYESKLRLAFIGPSGSGKTMTSLIVAQRLADASGGRVALIDTERGSASKYADLYDFDVLELESYHPERYIEAINSAQSAGYGVLVIDSLSHAWSGKDGALELVDREAKRSKSANTFAAWREVTPIHNRLVDTMTGCALHLIGTMRSKMDYVQTTDDKGRTIIKKVGMQPIQRDGLEYEFDVVGDLDSSNTLVIGKSRCPALSGLIVEKPDGAIAETLLAWLSGAAPPPKAASKESLAALAVLRESANVEVDELRAECRHRFGTSDARQLTQVQVTELADWLQEKAQPESSGSQPAVGKEA
jgi:hypothetical protein